jgi:hypothetical protein
LASLVAIATAALTMTGTAGADTASYYVSQTTPIAVATTNPCTGDPVTLTGTYHFESNYSVTVDTTGVSFHSQELKKYALSGTGASGARYQNEQQLMSEFNGTFVFDLGGFAPYEETDETTMLLVRQGETATMTGGDDFYTKILGHITYNANGVVTVSGITVNVFCR